ncbi:hypothetical protein MMC26_003271 [Xylographa opegraphella]|nr:hypothetical protein [Xylographa opegraphella]
MSHYLSTFLYEPIARQARRFSSPHITDPVQDLTTDHGGETNGRLRIYEEEDSSALDIDGNNEMSTISDQPLVLSPTSEDGGLEEALQTLQHNELGTSPFDRGSTASSEQTVDASRLDGTSLQTLHREDRPHRTTARFRSANTSISSSMNDTGLAHSGSPSSSRRSTLQDAVVSGIQSYMNDGVLPEDDGMRIMRKKIIAIQSQDISTAEKSRLMHELMIQPYSSHHPNLMLPNYPRNRSPGSFRSQDRPFTPSSGLSISDTMHSSPPQTSASSVGDQENICQVTLEDLTPTYWISPVTPTGSIITSYPTTRESAETLMGQNVQDDQDRDLGCAHYKRNVKLQCSACYRWTAVYPVLDIIAEYASFGMTTPEKAYTTVMTVGFVEWAKGLGKIFITVKCDSYNTAQISIIGNPRSVSGIDIQNDGNSQIRDDVDLLLPEAVQAFSRGRTSGRNSLIRRPATSATALDALRTRPSEVRLRDVHSASPPAGGWIVIPDGGAQALAPTDAMDMDDEDDDDDDVDFWGGESPRDRALSAERRARDAATMDDSDDDSDDSDEIMDDESEEEDDDDDHMDIFGHR